MALQFNGGARVPGSLGNASRGVGQRVPGPIGRTLWDKQSTPSAQATLAKAVKTTPMPPPLAFESGVDVHAVTWHLFKKDPAFKEVQQAPGINNCPVASILAAMAFTAVGQAYIKQLVPEKAGNVLTDHRACRRVLCPTCHLAPRSVRPDTSP